MSVSERSSTLTRTWLIVLGVVVLAGIAYLAKTGLLVRRFARRFGDARRIAIGPTPRRRS